MEARGQLGGVRALLTPCGSQLLNSGGKSLSLQSHLTSVITFHQSDLCTDSLVYTERVPSREGRNPFVLK